ncbi:unnamed protein product [Bubo scandiacus]
MNTGYAGQTELPENLKALFRLCAMVVPDIELIPEIVLVAEGFIDAHLLARILCRELLSKQDHYDWGLHAIKSVLVVVGSLKQGDENRPEDQALMQALRDLNLPKIVTDDIPVFMSLISDLFPALDPEESFILKVVQLEELLEVHHSVFVIGNAGTGKSKVPAYLCSVFSISHCKEIAMVLAENILRLAFALGCSVITCCSGHPLSYMINTTNNNNSNSNNNEQSKICTDTPVRAERSHNTRVHRLSALRHPGVTSACEKQRQTLKQNFSSSCPTSSASVLRLLPHSQPHRWMGVYSQYTVVSFCHSFLLQQEALPLLQHGLSMGCSPSEHIHLLQPRDFSRLQCGYLFQQRGAPPPLLPLTLLSDYQAEFSCWWLKKAKAEKFPSQGTLFSYYFDPEMRKFLPWVDKVLSPDVDPDAPLQAIFVRTSETACLEYFIDLLLTKGKPVMLVGNAGVGVFVGNRLAALSEDYPLANIPLDYYTTSSVLQKMVKKKAGEKKAGHSYSPVENKKHIYFIDNLNIPQVDRYGMVQPHALIGQHIDYRHRYYKQKLAIKEIHNCQYITCMNPPVGSFIINPRLQNVEDQVLLQSLLIYCHFANGRADPCYKPVKGCESLRNILEEFLESYNEMHASVNLVLFEVPCVSAISISCILEAPTGYALLIGVGGSGKQSLSRLAAYICFLKVDLASLHIKTGAKNMPSVFLLTDAQVPDECFLVLINDLLASGEVPDLFSDEDVEDIVTGVRDEVILCFSPTSATLRAQARKFPAIVNCTAIDWFHEWPREALHSISRRLFEEAKGVEPLIQDFIRDFMAYAHTSVNMLSAKYNRNES